jgi:hypothetical protein
MHLHGKNSAMQNEALSKMLSAPGVEPVDLGDFLVWNARQAVFNRGKQEKLYPN